MNYELEMRGCKGEVVVDLPPQKHKILRFQHPPDGHLLNNMALGTSPEGHLLSNMALGTSPEGHSLNNMALGTSPKGHLLNNMTLKTST